MTQIKPEDAVRTYLLYLEDPEQLKDHKEIEKRTVAVMDATDPIEKLKALSALEQAAKVDEAPLRTAFIEHVKAWAEAEAIPISAFRELRVSDEVLTTAGFQIPASAPGKRRNGKRNVGVSVETIKATILKMGGKPFLLADAEAKAGGSPATVRKALSELVEAEKVENLGTLADYQGRGRAPIQYRLK